MAAEVHDLAARRHREEQRRLLEAAEEHLRVLSGLGRAVVLAAAADPPALPAAEEALKDAVWRLLPYLTAREDELAALLVMVGTEAGRRVRPAPTGSAAGVASAVERTSDG